MHTTVDIVAPHFFIREISLILYVQDTTPGYSAVVTQPIDLDIISRKIGQRRHYKAIEDFDRDLQLMFRNCFTFYLDRFEYADNNRLWVSSQSAAVTAYNNLADTHVLFCRRFLGRGDPAVRLAPVLPERAERAEGGRVAGGGAARGSQSSAGGARTTGAGARARR